MKKNIVHVRRNLHELIKSLPAIKAHCDAEVLKRHLALIAYYQSVYDQLTVPTPTKA